MWNEQTKEWTYNMENIKINQVLAGWHENDQAVYKDVLARPLPPDDLSTHFIDPDTGKPMEYGSWREGSLNMVNFESVEYTLPVSYVSVRIRGGVDVGGGLVMLLSVPVGIDSESIIALPLPFFGDDKGLFMVGISNEDIATGDVRKILGGQGKIIPKESVLNLLNGKLFGQQALIQINHNFPSNIKLSKFDNVGTAEQINRMAAGTISFLNGNPQKPDFVFKDDGQQFAVWQRLYLPQEKTGPIQIN